MKTMTYGLLAASITLLSSPIWAQDEIFSEAGEFSTVVDAQANRHVIPVEAGTTIEVIVISDDVDTTLSATLPDGQRFTNDDYDDLNAGFIRAILTDGNLEIIASPLSEGETGSYRVVARTLPPPQMIGIGESVTGRLTGTAQGKAGHRYQLEGNAGERVVIDLRSYDFDTYLELQTEDGEMLSDDDGGDQGTNSRLHYQFEQDGTILLTASGLNSDDTGQYTINAGALSEEVYAQHEGRLTQDDTRGYDGTLFDRYEIEGQAGETLTVMLESNDFDTVLYISNPDGSNLTEQDDHNEDTNSLAVVNLTENGTYAIYVTSFDNDTGRYELTIYR